MSREQELMRTINIDRLLRIFGYSPREIDALPQPVKDTITAEAREAIQQHDKEQNTVEK